MLISSNNIASKICTQIFTERQTAHKPPYIEAKLLQTSEWHGRHTRCPQTRCGKKACRFSCFCPWLRYFSTREEFTVNVMYRLMRRRAFQINSYKLKIFRLCPIVFLGFHHLSVSIQVLSVVYIGPGQVYPVDVIVKALLREKHLHITSFIFWMLQSSLLLSPIS